MGICISKFKISNSNLNKVFNIVTIHKKHLCETPSTRYKSTKQKQLHQSNSDTFHIFSCHPTSKGNTKRSKIENGRAKEKTQVEKKKITNLIKRPKTNTPQTRSKHSQL